MLYLADAPDPRIGFLLFCQNLKEKVMAMKVLVF